MKKMMSNKKFLAITVPVASFLLVLIIVLAILAQDTLVGGIHGGRGSILMTN